MYALAAWQWEEFLPLFNLDYIRNSQTIQSNFCYLFYIYCYYWAKEQKKPLSALRYFCTLSNSCPGFLFIQTDAVGIMSNESKKGRINFFQIAQKTIMYYNGKNRFHEYARKKYKLLSV